MAEIGESPVDQVQPQTTQDIKQTNGTDFVNGMSSPDDLKVMEPYKTQGDDEFTPKQSTNGEFGMDQDNPFGVQGHNQDLLSDTTDQQVPQNLDTFDTLPSDMGTSVDEPSQKTTGADGILIDFEGKEIPKPNTVPGMQRLNPFVQSNEMETNSSNPFLSDFSKPPDQVGLTESMECHEDQDISPSDDSSLTSSSLSQRQDVPIVEQQFQSDIAPVDATEMECEPSPSNFDQSLSSAVGVSMPETYEADDFQTEEIRSGDSAIEFGDQAQDVIQDDVAQSAEDIPAVKAEMEEFPSQHERKISHDEQIVPGVCSCIEPEPESSGSEHDHKEELESVQKVEERPTPEIRLQREETDYVDSGELDAENDGNVNEYYDDESDEDELTPSENLTRSGEGELVVMSDPGVLRRDNEDDYSDEGEGAEIYTDESYSDEEYVEGEGEGGNRESDEREISSEYSEEGALRCSSEREVSPLVGDGSSKEASPPVNVVKDQGPILDVKETDFMEQNVPFENKSVSDINVITNKEDVEEGIMPPYPKDVDEDATGDVRHHVDESQLEKDHEEPESMIPQDQAEEVATGDVRHHVDERQLEKDHEEPELMIPQDQAEEVEEEFDSVVQQDLDDVQMSQESFERGEYEGGALDEVAKDVHMESQLNEVGFEAEQNLETVEKEEYGDSNRNGMEIETEEQDVQSALHDEEVMEQLSQAPDLSTTQLKTPESISKQEEFEAANEHQEHQTQEPLNDQIEFQTTKGQSDRIKFDQESDDDQYDQEIPKDHGQEDYNEADEHTDVLDSQNEEPLVEDQKESDVLEPQTSERDQVEPHFDKDLVSDQNMGDQTHFENAEQQFKPEPIIQSEFPMDNIEANEEVDDFESEKVNEFPESQFETSQEVEGKICLNAYENVESDEHAMKETGFEPKVDVSAANEVCEESQTAFLEDVSEGKKNILDLDHGREAFDAVHPFPVTPQGVPPPITPDSQGGEEMLPAVIGKQLDGEVDEDLGAGPVENGIEREDPQVGVNGDIEDNGVELKGHDLGKPEREVSDNELELDQKPKDVIKKGDSVVIESEGSDMEERSITPDPNQIIEMQEKLMKDKTDLQSEENNEVVEECTGQDLMSASMHESISLEKGQGIEDLQEQSFDDMPVVGRESGAMEGSFILEEGQTVDDLPQGEGSMMGGSFIMEQGQTIEDLEDAGVQEVSNGSPDEEIPVQMTRSAMEDSAILDEGHTFDDEAMPDQMTGSMMASSIVLNEEESFDNQQYQPELEQAEESSSTEIQPPSGDVDAMTGSLNVMTGSVILDEGEQLEDTFPESDISKSAMGGSMVLDEGETLEDRLPLPETKMSASISESYSESQAEESSLLEQEESRKESEEEILPCVEAEKVYTEEETKYQQEAAQNMVENVLNDAIDKVESMQKETLENEIKKEVGGKKVEEETKHVIKIEEKKTEKTDVEKKEEVKKSKHVTEKRVGRVKTKTEKEKKNESVLIKETKKMEKKVTEVKKERPKPTVTRTNGDDVFSRLYEDSSKRNERARRTPEKPEADTKIPSPTKSDLSKRSVSATRYGRRTQRTEDDREGEAAEKKESRSKSTPRPYTAPGARASRPTQLQRAKKDVSSDSGVEEDKSARQSSASSQKKKYGIDAKNDSYKPGGGRVKIFDQKVQVKASSRIDVGSKTPPGGTKPVNGSPKKESPRPKPSTPKGSSPGVKNVSSRIGSLDNAKHTPGGGKVNIVTKKTDYSKVSSRVGSTANMDHRPGGGEKKPRSTPKSEAKIQSQKLDWKTGSRIGSMDNARHSPGGGNVKITDEKLNWSVSSRVGSLDNAKHSPGGGNVQIESRKVDFKDKAHSKVGSTDNIGHKPAGGTKRIETQRLDFKDKAKSRVDAKSDHKPGGGDKKIETQKLNFKETAKPKTDSGKGAQPRTESVTSQED